MVSSSSYAYEQRKDIRPISWEDFHALTKGLALAAASYSPEIVLGIARGGLYPAALLAQMLQVELYPIRLTRRVNDVVVRDRPEWLVLPPAAVSGRRVLVVDEISATGETLAFARAEALRMGAAQVRCAVLYAHTAGVDAAEIIGLIGDELFLNPWDREILQDGEFVFHPEYVGALAAQGLVPDPSLRIPVGVIQPAKQA